MKLKVIFRTRSGLPIIFFNSPEGLKVYSSADGESVCSEASFHRSQRIPQLAALPYAFLKEVTDKYGAIEIKHSLRQLTNG